MVLAILGHAQCSATFERLMDNLLGDLLCLIYLGDVIVHAKIFDEGLKMLILIFSRFRAAHLKLNPEKCELFRRRVATDPDNIEVVKN